MNGDRGRKDSQEPEKPGTPWGFFLVLAAIVVVAIVYSVTILALDADQRTPEIVFGAMAACFTVIGTLVGTYFGVKAGLDGQDKMKQTLARFDLDSRERQQERAEKSRDQRDRERRREDGRLAPREPREVGTGAHVERRDWDGGSV